MGREIMALVVIVTGVQTHNLIWHPPKGKKIKCTLVQALRLCTGRTANMESRGLALLFHDQRH